MMSCYSREAVNFCKSFYFLVRDAKCLIISFSTQKLQLSLESCAFERRIRSFLSALRPSASVYQSFLNDSNFYIGPRRKAAIRYSQTPKLLTVIMLTSIDSPQKRRRSNRWGLLYHGFSTAIDRSNIYARQQVGPT